MTKQEIITKFNLYIDDTSELSSAEESDLFDKVYNRIISSRPWEICKKAGTGTTSTSVDYIALPSDFAFLVQNANSTDMNSENYGPVVFVGSDFQPYKVVSFNDRRQYRNQDGYCYIDIVNNRLYFTLQPTAAEAVEFDYYFIPAALGLAEEPVFPERFHDAIYHGMCVDSFVIQQSDKARSYAGENERMYKAILEDMNYWNANLIQLN